jgi:molybdopterin converting factor small subunit
LDAIDKLNEKYGTIFKEETGMKFTNAIKNYFNVFLNKERLSLPLDLRKKLKDKDQLIIVRPVGGG